MALFEQSYTLQSLKKMSFLHVDVKERTSRQYRFIRGSSFPFPMDGGPDWTRTSDPTLIKRVL